MKITDKFGIIIPCYEGDIHFVRALCCSIKYFVGDIPICLIVDGDFSTRDLETCYGVTTLKRHDISNKKLREKSFGYGLTKMVVFWESPFEKFLLIDGDALFWGDLLKIVRDLNYDYDFIVDKPNQKPPLEYINKFYFETDRLEKIDPNFDWQDREYFNTGVIFGSCGILDLEEYLFHLDRHIDAEQNSSLFKYGEMGFLNYFLFKSADLNKIKLKQLKLQIMVNDYIYEYRAKDFNKLPKYTGKELKLEMEPLALHWAGQKPYLLMDKTYSWPMNVFREKHYQDNYNYSTLMAKLAVAVEDINFLTKKFERKLKKEISLAIEKKSVFTSAKN
jgi:hypothetical protein